MATDTIATTWQQKRKEGKMTSGLLLLANESKAVPCFLWDHGYQVDHQILENPEIHIKSIDFSFIRERLELFCL